MYYECRHIMPNGARCHSPAMREMNYCYFHARLHRLGSTHTGSKPAAKDEPLKLPILEDRSAIQVALYQILDKLCSSNLDTRRAGLLLYAVQIASQNVERKTDILPFKAVQSVFLSPEGEEISSRLRVCEPSDKCSACDLRETCKDYEPDEEEEEED